MRIRLRQRVFYRRRERTAETSLVRNVSRAARICGRQQCDVLPDRRCRLWENRDQHYIDLGSQTIAFSPQPLLSVGVSTAYRENIFRVGANYAFDWGLPTVSFAARQRT